MMKKACEINMFLVEIRCDSLKASHLGFPLLLSNQAYGGSLFLYLIEKGIRDIKS